MLIDREADAFCSVAGGSDRLRAMEDDAVLEMVTVRKSRGICGLTAIARCLK